jgi:hypothetical protein
LNNNDFGSFRYIKVYPNEEPSQAGGVYQDIYVVRKENESVGGGNHIGLERFGFQSGPGLLLSLPGPAPFQLEACRDQ